MKADPRDNLQAVLVALRAERGRVYATVIAERLNADPRKTRLALHHLRAQGKVIGGIGGWEAV